MRAPLLTIQGLSKTFPGLRALDNVSLSVGSGEILAVVGQNGSGKSTLVKILAGIHHADPGVVVELRGTDGRALSGQAAREALHFIHQDLGLIPMLSTIENLGLGAGQRGHGLLPARRKEEFHHAIDLIGRFGASFDVRTPVAELTPAERAIVAIARALD